MSAPYGGYTAAYVYIMTNRDRTTLYVGITPDLERLLCEKRQSGSGVQTTDGSPFDLLMYWEAYTRRAQAIVRESRLQDWHQSRKAALVTTRNPDWLDLSDVFLRG